jgi:hypothetical protein
MDVTSEELIELLKKAQEERSQPKRKVKRAYTVQKFIDKFNIQPGEDRVPGFVIYYTYKRKWTEEYDRNKVSKDTFFKEFKKQFEQRRTGKGRFYLVNKNSFDVSHQGILEAKYYDEKYRQRQKEKRQAKISKSKEKPKHKS